MLNWTNQFAENIVQKRMIQSQIRYCYFFHKHPKKSYGGCQYKHKVYKVQSTFVCLFVILIGDWLTSRFHYTGKTWQNFFEKLTLSVPWKKVRKKSQYEMEVAIIFLIFHVISFITATAIFHNK